jgi:hypothetical protein
MPGNRIALLGVVAPTATRNIAVIGIGANDFYQPVKALEACGHGIGEVDQNPTVAWDLLSMYDQNNGGAALHSIRGIRNTMGYKIGSRQ